MTERASVAGIDLLKGQRAVEEACQLEHTSKPASVLMEARLLTWAKLMNSLTAVRCDVTTECKIMQASLSHCD